MFDGGVGGEEVRGEVKAAAYGSWPAFDRSLVQLRAGEVPPKLRRELLDHLFSPTVVTQSLAAFRFLGLTDDEDRPTALLPEFLAAYGTPAWPSVLRGVLERAYPRIMALDLSRVTREQLDEEFKAFPGSSDAVRAKAVSFFLAAAREADISLSPDLAEPRRRTPGEDARRRIRNYLAHGGQMPEHGTLTMHANALLAAIAPHAAEAPRNALLPPAAAPESRSAPYRAAFAALSAVWEPDTMPEDVDAAVVTVLRYLRKKETEATKA